MRSVDEMIQAALTLRNKLLQEQKDPTEGVFHVTTEERIMLLDKAPFNHPAMSPGRERLCGLKLMVI